MVAVQMASAFLSRIPPTLAPALAAERGWSDAVVGYLASINMLGSILFLALGAPVLHVVNTNVRRLQIESKRRAAFAARFLLRHCT